MARSKSSDDSQQWNSLDAADRPVYIDRGRFMCQRHQWRTVAATPVRSAWCASGATLTPGSRGERTNPSYSRRLPEPPYSGRRRNGVGCRSKPSSRKAPSLWPPKGEASSGFGIPPCGVDPVRKVSLCGAS
jgi:hypothetical protein